MKSSRIAKFPPASGTAPVAGVHSVEKSPLSTWTLRPTRVVWQSPSGVQDASALLREGAGQAGFAPDAVGVTLCAGAKSPASVLLDFGAELVGGVELITPQQASPKPVTVRLRFGESVAEAMAESDATGKPTNDHALRDLRVELPWFGSRRIGPTGFRFLRIDAVIPGEVVKIDQVRAWLELRDVPRLGSFASSDPLLDRIWEVGAYTVHLNMQRYLYDGVKRDRLVWVGDLHPEVCTVHAVFGSNPVIQDSLNFVRDETPPDRWMNGISSYSIWWIIIQEEVWRYGGDRAGLAAQQGYLESLLLRLTTCVDDAGRERLDGMRFLDWPSQGNDDAVHAGLQALLLMALESGARLLRVLRRSHAAQTCESTVARMRRHAPPINGSKQAAALLALAGLQDAETVARQVLLPRGARGISTFYGFYVLKALTRGHQTPAALKIVRDYWGGMLKLGATSFWEHFEMDWLKRAGRIDELPQSGKVDVHGAYGDHCFVGYRNSLAHGWASGPTAWLSETVLGVRPVTPGGTQICIEPELGDLEWAAGTVPTPRGLVRVHHRQRKNGRVVSEIELPKGVKVVPGGAARK